ncbi:hypothetical protein [Mesorhizobium sp.]|uniref:hypothetical protein n=1 Tax=Mesorhizobium sp. TaxID=1871066 RepID=UPI0025BA9437|nr:hypothetical protein [Mesorhizobium sp.]
MLRWHWQGGGRLQQSFVSASRNRRFLIAADHYHGRRWDDRSTSEKDKTMNIKAICLGAFALSVLGSVAFAGALDSPSNMQPFYTDASMKTMKSDTEFKAAWNAMSQDKRNATKKECNDAAMSKPYAEFCVKVHQLGGNS